MADLLLFGLALLVFERYELVASDVSQNFASHVRALQVRCPNVYGIAILSEQHLIQF